MKKVSVVIPVYNSENYISECLNSVLEQKYKNLEVVCIDDGSQDSSIKILKEFERKDSRIKVIMTKHSNAGKARNEGLDVVSGEYVLFLDSDDFIYNNLISSCYEIMEQENSDIVVFAVNEYNTITKKKKFLDWSLREENCPTSRPFSPNDMSNYIFNSFSTWSWNKMFRKSFLDKNHLKFQEIPRTNDFQFVLLALILSERISIINKSLISYRVGMTNNLQATNHLSPLSFWEAYIDTKRKLEEMGVYSIYQKSYVNCVLEGTFSNLYRLKNSIAKEYVTNTIIVGLDYEFGIIQQGRGYIYNPELYDNYMKLYHSRKIDYFEYHRMELDYERIKKSLSYRIGNAVTLIPRKIRKIVEAKE